jgi:hypothetical protein
LAAAGFFVDIVRRLFRADAPAGLEMNSIRNADGELGLRVRGASAYFGLIYVGDAPAFRDLVEEHAPDVEIGEEVIAGPLFPTVNRVGSDLQMLIGAKKFVEGWDSWRVSNMCLLNVGRSEGSEIIQLFGRGVRLKGLNGTLKRSTLASNSQTSTGPAATTRALCATASAASPRARWCSARVIPHPGQSLPVTARRRHRLPAESSAAGGTARATSAAAASAANAAPARHLPASVPDQRVALGILVRPREDHDEVHQRPDSAPPPR